MKKAGIAVLLVAIVVACAILLWPTDNKTVADPNDPLAKLNIKLPDKKPDPGEIANMPNPFGAPPAPDALAVPNTPMAPAPTQIDTPSSTMMGRNVQLPPSLKEDCGQLRAALMQEKITQRFIEKFSESRWGKYYRLSRGFAYYAACEAIEQHDPAPCTMIREINDNFYGECMVEYLMVEYLGKYLSDPANAMKVVKKLREFSDITISIMLADALEVIAKGSPEKCASFKGKDEGVYNICTAWFQKDLSYCTAFKTPQGSLYCTAMVSVSMNYDKSSWDPAREHPEWPYNIKHIREYWAAEPDEKPIECRDVLIDWLDRSCAGTTPF